MGDNVVLHINDKRLVSGKGLLHFMLLCCAPRSSRGYTSMTRQAAGVGCK